MPDFQPIPPMQELLGTIGRSWRRLQSTIHSADADALTRKTDPAGWSAKDHLAHLDACANSVLVMIRDGRPQWEGLGISKAMFEDLDFDDQNAVIRDTRAGQSLDEVLSSLSATHHEFVCVLADVSDEGIRRPCNEYVPDSGDFEIAQRVMWDTYMHYDEHRGYIERILAW